MAAGRDFSRLESCVCFHLRRAARLVTQHFDAELRRHGIRPTQTPILTVLDARAHIGIAELSELLGMERTTLLRNLRPLEREGLVRARAGEPRGKVELELTAKGKKALARVLPAWRAAQAKVLATLGEARWSALLGDLEQVARELAEA